jgi:hypothetical protein
MKSKHSVWSASRAWTSATVSLSCQAKVESARTDRVSCESRGKGMAGLSLVSLVYSHSARVIMAGLEVSLSLKSAVSVLPMSDMPSDGETSLSAGFILPFFLQTLFDNVLGMMQHTETGSATDAVCTDSSANGVAARRVEPSRGEDGCRGCSAAAAAG